MAMRKRGFARRTKHPGPPALPTPPYYDGAKQVAYFCAGEDEAREFAQYLLEHDVDATAMVPSDFPDTFIPKVICAPIASGGPSHVDVANYYESFKTYETISRAEAQYRNLQALVKQIAKCKQRVQRDQLVEALGQAALPGIQADLSYHVGHHYLLRAKGELSPRAWDKMVVELLRDGKIEQPGDHPHWKPHVLLWEGNDDCSSAKSFRFPEKLWTISRVDEKFHLYLGGHELPGIDYMFRQNAVALAEAYEKVLADPPGEVAQRISTLIGKSIRLHGYGGERDAIGRIAYVNDDTIGVVLDFDRKCESLTFSRHNGMLLPAAPSEGWRVPAETILADLDRQFPLSTYKQKSPSERPVLNSLAAQARRDETWDWFQDLTAAQTKLLEDRLSDSGLDFLFPEEGPAAREAHTLEEENTDEEVQDWFDGQDAVKDEGTDFLFAEVIVKARSQGPDPEVWEWFELLAAAQDGYYDCMGHSAQQEFYDTTPSAAELTAKKGLDREAREKGSRIEMARRAIARMEERLGRPLAQSEVFYYMKAANAGYTDCAAKLKNSKMKHNPAPRGEAFSRLRAANGDEWMAAYMVGWKHYIWRRQEEATEWTS